MIFSDGFYVDIDRIYIAHECVLDRIHKCEYPTGRGHYGLVFVQNGSAEYRFFTGERPVVGRGDVLFLSPDCAYSIVAEKAFKHYTVNFDIHEASSALHALGQPYSLLHVKGTDAMERSFKQLIGAWSLKGAGYEMRAVGHLYELMSQFYVAYTDEQHTVAHQRLLPAKEYIEQHFDQPMTLKHLAFLSNMSVTNFRREWKKHYVESPMQYRDSIRLNCAREYLMSEYYTVTEVAKKCGFEDVSYFVRFFKQKTETTPGEFKKKFSGA